MCVISRSRNLTIQVQNKQRNEKFQIEPFIYIFLLFTVIFEKKIGQIWKEIEQMKIKNMRVKIRTEVNLTQLKHQLDQHFGELETLLSDLIR